MSHYDKFREKRIIYTFWCEYDLGINDNVYETEKSLREDVKEALKGCGVDSLQELESEGLFYIETKEIK